MKRAFEAHMTMYFFKELLEREGDHLPNINNLRNELFNFSTTYYDNTEERISLDERIYSYVETTGLLKQMSDFRDNLKYQGQYLNKTLHGNL